MILVLSIQNINVCLHREPNSDDCNVLLYVLYGDLFEMRGNIYLSISISIYLYIYIYTRKGISHRSSITCIMMLVLLYGTYYYMVRIIIWYAFRENIRISLIKYRILMCVSCSFSYLLFNLNCS